MPGRPMKPVSLLKAGEWVRWGGQGWYEVEQDVIVSPDRWAHVRLKGWGTPVCTIQPDIEMPWGHVNPMAEVPT